MKNISVLGSTGSIGTQAIEVACSLNYNIIAIAANNNTSLLVNQAKKLKPKVVCIYNDALYLQLKQELFGLDIEVVSGMEGLCYAACLDECDILLNAVVGIVGLKPTLTAIEKGIDIALANKETLVTGGALVTKLAKQKNVNIFPVDSEHSAIFQCLQGNTNNKIKKILLTASGGPFYGKKKSELAHISVKQALAHPNWDMGAKITIDSATLMNKGLELIEAVHIFDVAPSDIEIIIHRQSVIHSMVEFEDNSIIAQFGVPDMRLPISYALTYPKRLPGNAPALNFSKYPVLTFDTPDTKTFICLQCAIDAITKGGLAPTILNGANEQAVELFLNNKIPFLKIGELVAEALTINTPKELTFDNIIACDTIARDFVKSKTNF